MGIDNGHKDDEEVGDPPRRGDARYDLGPLFSVTPAAFDWMVLTGPEGQQVAVMVLMSPIGQIGFAFDAAALDKLADQAKEVASRIKIQLADPGIFQHLKPPPQQG